jgi:endonuclease/exonuclease/phosphatase (EEP) superfamily protein YafD
MTLAMSLLRACAGAFVLGTGTIAILAALGFASPQLDVLNSLQALIFPAAVIALVVVALLFREGPFSAFLVAFATTGFIASAGTYLPEVIGGWTAPRPPPSVERPALRAMTHNLFGLNYDMKRVAANIFAEDPDIVALQEYFPEQREALHALLVPRYPHFAYCVGGKRANIAIYSKLAFSEANAGACAERATGEQRTARIVARFTLADGSTFSVMTTHLDSPFNAPRQQAQMADLAAAIAAVPGPLIVVGDFNSTPWSYALRRFVGATGLVRQTRNLVTWPLSFGGDDGLIRMLPFLPLDHVLTRGIDVHQLRTTADDGSDHLPVLFTFSVAK